MTRGNIALLRNTVAWLAALIVAGYFVYAAIPKIADPRQFALDIRNYRILPEQLVNLAALYMPWLEACAAAALVLPLTRRAGAVLIAGLLLLFIAAVSYSAFYLGLDISCGCTGKESSGAGWWTIIRNTILLAGTAAAVWLPVRVPSSRATRFEVLPPQAAQTAN